LREKGRAELADGKRKEGWDGISIETGRRSTPGKEREAWAIHFSQGNERPVQRRATKRKRFHKRKIPFPEKEKGKKIQLSMS